MQSGEEQLRYSAWKMQAVTQHCWCSIKYLTVPNNSHLCHCACAISQSLVHWCLFI